MVTTFPLNMGVPNLNSHSSILKNKIKIKIKYIYIYFLFTLCKKELKGLAMLSIEKDSFDKLKT